jgi:hypothetical protein
MRILPLRVCSGLLVVVALLFGSLFAGCEELTTADGGVIATDTTMGGDTVSTEPISSTDTLAPLATVPPTTASHTPATVSSSEWIAEDGHIKVLGFITNAWADGSGRHLTIDYATLITGNAAATAAAIEDGVIAPGETWDPEFYIDNDNPKLRTYRVSDSAEIYTQFRNHLVTLDGMPCSWADFDGFWGGGALAEGDAHLPTSPWWIERDGDTVVWIMQMFTP